MLQPHDKRILAQKLQNYFVRKYTNHNFFSELILRSTYGELDIYTLSTTKLDGTNPSEDHMKLIKQELVAYDCEEGKNVFEKDNSITIYIDYSKIE